jgi:hypothetical protein
LQPAALATAFEHLTAPSTFSDANGNLIPVFRTLSVSQQISVILSVRASPSKFPQGAKCTLQQLVAAENEERKEENGEAPYVPLVRMLANSERPPPCPEFLYTKKPSFPWAPELCTIEEANIKRKNAAVQYAAAHRQQAAVAGGEGAKNEAMEVDDSDKNKLSSSKSDSRLLEAQACIRAELTSTMTTTTATSLSPSCLAALDVVLNAASAIGFSQPLSLGMTTKTNSTTTTTDDLLDGAGLRNKLPDDIVLFIITATVSPSSSLSRCTTVARNILLPAVVALDAPPTQSLTAAAQHVGKSNPKALIEHCWIPIIGLSTPTLNKYHSEFILRSIKQGAVPVDLLYLLLDAAVQAVQNWNDYVLAMLQTILDIRPTVPLPTTPTVTSLAAALLQAGVSSNFKGSIKLGKLLLTFVKGYGKQLSCSQEAVEQCRRASQSIGTFMMKPTLAALDKCLENSRK